MKKIMTAIGAMFILLTGVFTSCDFSDFVAPTDQWVWKSSKTSDTSFTYKWTSDEGTEKSVSFDIYVNYATKDSTLSFKNSGTADVKEGVNVLLVPSKDSDKSALEELISESTGVDEICIFKALGTKVSASSSESATDNTESSSDKQIEFSQTLWTLVYNFNKFESYTDKQFDQVTESLTLASTSTKLSWKKVLYNMLGSQLFDDN